jgi:hypothetical protein
VRAGLRRRGRGPRRQAALAGFERRQAFDEKDIVSGGETLPGDLGEMVGRKVTWKTGTDTKLATYGDPESSQAEPAISV